MRRSVFLTAGLSTAALATTGVPSSTSAAGDPACRTVRGAWIITISSKGRTVSCPEAVSLMRTYFQGRTPVDRVQGHPYDCVGGSAGGSCDGDYGLYFAWSGRRWHHRKRVVRVVKVPTYKIVEATREWTGTTRAVDRSECRTGSPNLDGGAPTQSDVPGSSGFVVQDPAVGLQIPVTVVGTEPSTQQKTVYSTVATIREADYPGAGIGGDTAGGAVIRLGQPAQCPVDGTYSIPSIPEKVRYFVQTRVRSGTKKVKRVTYVYS